MHIHTYLALSLICLLTVSCASPDPQTSPAAAAVRVVTAPVLETPAGVERYTGTVQAPIDSALGFRVPGKISARLVDPGQTVQAGQRLLALDDANLQVAAAAAAQRLTVARAEAERATAEEARMRDLVADQTVSRSLYEVALATFRSAVANVEAAELAEQDARLNLSYATLSSDTAGLVIDVLAQPGQVVAAGTPVIRLAQAGPREAVVAIPETRLPTLPKTGVARIFGATAEVPVHLRSVTGLADPATRTFDARYVLGEAASAAPLGATVTVTLAAASEPTVQIPLGALYDPGTGPGVWLVQEDLTLAFRAVTLRKLHADRCELAPGSIQAGERVVALGAPWLRAGQRVSVAEGRP